MTLDWVSSGSDLLAFPLELLTKSIDSGLGQLRLRSVSFSIRIIWKINLTYSPTVEQLEKIRTEIKEYILANKNFEVKGGLDPVVKVIELGSSSIDILIVAYASPLGFAEFNELKEQLVFNIMKIVKANNSDFAFPSTSLYVESMP